MYGVFRSKKKIGQPNWSSRPNMVTLKKTFRFDTMNMDKRVKAHYNDPLCVVTIFWDHGHF